MTTVVSHYFPRGQAIGPRTAGTGKGGKRPRPGRGPDIGTVGLDAISGSICYAAAPPEATAAAYCMALYGCHGELARHTRL